MKYHQIIEIMMYYQMQSFKTINPYKLLKEYGLFRMTLVFNVISLKIVKIYLLNILQIHNWLSVKMKLFDSKKSMNLNWSVIKMRLVICKIW